MKNKKKTLQNYRTTRNTHTHTYTKTRIDGKYPDTNILTQSNQYYIYCIFEYNTILFHELLSKTLNKKNFI